MTLDANPLLSRDDLADFSRIQADHVAPAIQALLKEAAQALEQAVSSETPVDYRATSLALDVPLERLNRAWDAVGHLNAVAQTPEIRAAYNEQLPAVTAFYTQLSSDERLFERYLALRQAEVDLNAAQRRALDNAIRDFELSGARLKGEARERYTAIRARRAELSQQFSDHVLDATDGFQLDVPSERLAGLPSDTLAAAEAAAKAAGVEGARLTLHAPCYLPVMQHVRDRQIRADLYRAYVTRASEFGPAERDNTALMREDVALRHEEAALLGYPHFAAVSLAPKMADDPQQVQGFLRDLARRAKPFAERDLAQVRAFAKEELGLTDLQPWDIPFASERLREARYAYSDEEVRAYFTLPKVLAGLFAIIETVFDVQIERDEAPVWHPSASFYRVSRKTAAGTGSDAAPQAIAYFYLDVHARSGKRPGAWMSDARARWLRPDTGQLQTPVARLTCNFASPQGDRPALLSHDDVITLFHEFGHGLHHMLTQVDELAVSGISGVEWDAVELPSQFMENFCWEWEVLQRLTSHVDTGEPLPRALFDKMTAARHFQSGLALLRQIEFGLFDMRLHSEPGRETDIQGLLNEVRSEVAVIMPPAFNRFQNTFSHIFAGGYAAGYYSYLWAEVLSADAWSAFEESGVFDTATGRRLREAIFEVGGSRPAMESFRAFRGREPRIDALLRHQGLSEAS
jgi:oligopeptidase A